MEQKECKECKKVIEGYTENHVDHLMQQHLLKHVREKEQSNKKQEEKE